MFPPRGGLKASRSKRFGDFANCNFKLLFCHSECSEESPKLSELISELKSKPLFTSPLIRGEHNNPSLSREGFGMGFVQKNGAVNSINRSRIKCGMTNICHSVRSEESYELSKLTSKTKGTGFNKSKPLFTSPLIRGEHNNPSLSREGLGMGFVQKNKKKEL